MLLSQWLLPSWVYHNSGCAAKSQTVLSLRMSAHPLFLSPPTPYRSRRYVAVRIGCMKLGFRQFLSTLLDVIEIGQGNFLDWQEARTKARLFRVGFFHVEQHAMYKVHRINLFIHLDEENCTYIHSFSSFFSFLVHNRLLPQSISVGILANSLDDFGFFKSAISFAKAASTSSSFSSSFPLAASLSSFCITVG